MERFIWCVIFGKMLVPNVNLWKCDLTQCLSEGRGGCGGATLVGALTKEKLLPTMHPG